jgi:Flp pilus assembly protein TadD
MEASGSADQKAGQHPRQSHPLQSRHSPSPIFRTQNDHRLIICLLLFLTTIALYNPVTHAPFLNFDDVVYVTDNPQVRAGLTWHTVVWAFTSTQESNWHPITWLSHALDCQLFGLNPQGPHAVNVLLHAANVTLLFLILQTATGLAWRSLMVAALFALHPINVESVAWISERKNVLSMLFFLLALAAYGWYARRPSATRYLTVTAAFALGLMTKPQVVTFPFALFLLDYWPLCRIAGRRFEEHLQRPSGQTTPLWKLFAEKLPWFAMSAASAMITMKVQADATHVKLPLWIHVGNAALAYVSYLGKTFWPLNLAPIYQHPELSLTVAAAALSASAIIALSALAVIFRRQRPYFVGWLWFLGTLVPMIGLVQVGVQSMADRYAYIPLLGIFVIVCWGAADLIKLWHVPKLAVHAASAVLLLALGLALHRQVSFWQDNITLWTHTLQITKANYVAEDNLAVSLITTGQVDEALPHLQRARSLRPDDPTATLNIASIDQMHGNYQAAVDGYANVLKFTKNPYWVTASLLNGGYAYYSLNQYENARQNFVAVLNRRPDNAAAYRGLGLVAEKTGDIQQAANNFERSVELQPSPVGFLLLEQALALTGAPEAARQAHTKAAQMTSNLPADQATVRGLLAN